MKDVQTRFAADAPEFHAAARGDGSPPLGALLTADGRVGRLSPGGIEWVGTLTDKERAAAFAIAAEAATDKTRAFSVQDGDGTTLSGLLDASGTGQIVLSLAPTRRLNAEDFSEALPKPMFDYLRALVRLGENIWVCGDTGYELDFGAALVEDEQPFLVRAQQQRPVPFGGTSLEIRTMLDEALSARTLGGFSTVVFEGSLDLRLLEDLAQREGVILVQRASSIERTLSRAGILAQRESALELASFGAIVSLGRSATGGVMVRQIAECQPAGEGVAYTAIAGREGENARWLLPLSVPHRLMRLAEAGLEEAALAFERIAVADEPEAEEVFEAPPRRARVEPVDVEEELEDDDRSFDDDQEIDHDDPGWELDASVSKRSSGPSILRAAAEATARKSELVQAPGPAGKEGFLRARPVVRPSPREPDLEPGTLTLDQPSRKIIIPEAPSGSAAKRTFAEIMKERHRFPPVSENGPTLTPPVLRGADDDDDITP